MLIYAITTISAVAIAGSTTTPEAREGWHAQRHQQINDVVAKNAGDVDIVFVGDSITQSWESAGADVWKKFYGTRKAVNLGISGDRTEHVLWRLDNGNLKGIAPRVAVVMIGTNNIGHGTHETSEVLAGVRRVVERIHEISPSTRVLLLDIFPRGPEFNVARGRIMQINQALSRMDDSDSVVFLPIGKDFIEDDGTISTSIMPDALHLSPAGYKRWAVAIEPTLSRMLAAPPLKPSTP